jgi:prepilin-type N-terminal cleavage/methylation domain-containing protein
MTETKRIETGADGGSCARRGRGRRGGTSGFTFVEVLLSVVILSLCAAAISDVYTSGLTSLDARVTGGQLDSALRSQMEKLLALKFSSLADGSAPVTVEGDTYTVTWTVVNVDLDGDTTPEPTAKLITLTLSDRTLVTIVVDHEGRVGKI